MDSVADEPNLELVSESGVADVTAVEWAVAGAGFAISILLAMLARRVLERALRDRGGLHVLRHLAARGAAFLIVVLGFFYSLKSVNVAVTPLLGGLGILGIALAFALQDMLANFASGVLLHTRTPIRIGDQIVSNEFAGEVEDVNLRSTKLHTFDGETVYIPNSMVLQSPIINWTKTPIRRSTVMVNVPYDADLPTAQRIMVSAVTARPGIQIRPPVEAFACEFADSSIRVEVQFWHEAGYLDMWRARDQAVQAIKLALDEAGVTIEVIPKATEL